VRGVSKFKIYKEIKMENIGIYLAKDIKAEIENFELLQNFLEEVINNFKEVSDKFYEKWGYFPFTNGEKTGFISFTSCDI